MRKLASLSPADLRVWLQDEKELALLDVSEASHYAHSHIVAARHLPLSLLALQAPALLPRRGVRIVLCSADTDAGAAGEQVLRAAELLQELGCTQLWSLQGGLQAWQAQGGLLIDGYSTLVKAFGEKVRQHFSVPALSPQALAQRWQQGAPTTVVDVRTLGEHRYSTLPHALSYPGTEWPLRDLDAHPGATQPGHLWAVTCFSRTRGVIGTATQRLLHGADIPVAWVDDGVMAWVVQGHTDVSDTDDALDVLPPLAEPLARAKASELIARYALTSVDDAGLAQWRDDQERTVQLFDLRPGAVSRPGVQAVAGGQLLMHFENLVAVRHARVVLLDEPHQLRSAVTAFWLAQLGECDVFLYAGDANSIEVADCESGLSQSDEVQSITANVLASLLEQQQARLVDVGPSIEYVKMHIIEALHANAAALASLQRASAEALAQGQWLVLTSPDGKQASHAARALMRQLTTEGKKIVRWLEGGTQAWSAQSLPVEAEYSSEQLLTPFLDDWGSIMRVPQEKRLPAWERYLQWERNLVARLEGDPGVRFRFFDAAA